MTRSGVFFALSVSTSICAAGACGSSRPGNTDGGGAVPTSGSGSGSSTVTSSGSNGSSSGVSVVNPEAGPFCALDSGLVPPPTAPDPCVVQCVAPASFCQGPLPGQGAHWGCCVNPPLPDGAPNPRNSCSTATCGRQ
jgi:hypothetical protein